MGVHNGWELNTTVAIAYQSREGEMNTFYFQKETLHNEK